MLKYPFLIKVNPSRANWGSISMLKAYILFLNMSLLLLCCFFFMTNFQTSESHDSTLSVSFLRAFELGCKGFAKLKDSKGKCLYLQSYKPCDSNGYINYLYIFYCTCGRYPLLGYLLMLLWLIVLFYLLGNTASVYFCSSLESLSSVLKLSPTIAGVTLLSLGNGVPDVFAILVSFVGNGSQNVGINSMLGGAFFVSCVVVGIISLVMSSIWTRIDKSDFLRDVCFLLFGLFAILLVVVIGKINVWGAVGFTSLYIIYVLVVHIMHVYWKSDNIIEGSVYGFKSNYGNELGIPMLRNFAEEEIMKLDNDDIEAIDGIEIKTSRFGWFLYCIELPLYLPRRLTIPVVSEEKWSKPFAVISVTLAPILLAVVSSSHNNRFSSNARLTIYAIGGLIGVLLGVSAFLTTERSSPPKRFMFPWLVGGFAMSVLWSYITANELVALLVAIGNILGISSSVLGLTVLAWGNSIGDLITNVAMAVNGGPAGTQVAISGCYAGPIFNILVGLGLSLVLSTWHAYPSSLVITREPLLLETLGFLVVGLIWALVVLPLRNMKPDRFLGVGLLVIYLVSISFRLLQTLDFVY